ncbi:helix-turn-helix domain-containing protein [uncultured Thiodictyon sp.]|uniref:helix-turn-helix domain-containing protein n=1 Tax=uncultured Thiodictyon sp. TaxID=1846217 RepID=UPI003457ACE2
MKRKSDDLPRRRAEVILQVRSGRITATEGAGLLEISRKSYYQWEERALQAMLAALTDGSPGRPPGPRTDPENLRLKQQVQELENRLKMIEEVHELRAMMADLRPPKPTPSAQRQTKPKRKSPQSGREKKR